MLLLGEHIVANAAGHEPAECAAQTDIIEELVQINEVKQ
jgi:hypothetical protein